MLILILALALTIALAACGGTPAPSASPSSPVSAGPSGAALDTFDFSAVMSSFEKGQAKSADWDRSNIITADTTTTATIGVPHGEMTPVVMLKGNSGVLEATSKESGTLTTDPAKNSYVASAVLLKDGKAAQYGDGIFKFKMMAYGAQEGQWNNAVIFRASEPQKLLSDDSLTKALAIVTNGGVVQLQRNYKDDSGKLVKQDIVKDTGINIADNKYHYFVLALQDVSGGTNVKLWIDGQVAYSGVVTGVAGAGAIQLLSNSAPMFDAGGKPLITEGSKEGTFQVVTACTESYIGGYDDGPAIQDIALDPVK
jgi:hypothetical protein